MEIRIKIELAQKIFAYLYKTNPRLATEMFNGVVSLNPETQMFRREQKTPLESNSVCWKCGREAVGPKSLCCGTEVITPARYSRLWRKPRGNSEVGR